MSKRRRPRWLTASAAAIAFAAAITILARTRLIRRNLPWRRSDPSSPASPSAATSPTPPPRGPEPFSADSPSAATSPTPPPRRPDPSSQAWPAGATQQPPSKAAQAGAPVAGAVVAPTSDEPVVRPPATTGSAPALQEPSVARSRRRTVVGLLALAAGIIVIAAIVIALIRNGTDTAGPTPDGTSGRTAPSSAPAAQPAVPTRAAMVSTVRFRPGLAMTASEHVVFDSPVSSVTLTVPKRATAVGGGEFDPQIRNLQVRLDQGGPLDVSQSLHAGMSVRVDLPAATSRLDVIFTAYGAIARSTPSSANRAAALVTPLTMTHASAVTSTLHINGTNVTNIGCTQPDGSSQSCGTRTANGWTVKRGPGDQDVEVIAQLDLPG